MSIDDVTMITREALYTICITAAPVLLVSLTVGLIVSIFQTITSIQEQTLTFLPKLLVILGVLFLIGSPYIFICNALIVLFTLSFTLIMQRRMFGIFLISAISKLFTLLCYKFCFKW